MRNAVPKPDTLVDREREWEVLTRLWRSDRPELCFVVGRRRVGKSFVLAPLCDEVGGIYYQATRRTEAEQLRALTAAIALRFEDRGLEVGGGFSDWETLFDYVIERARDRPVLLVLDEFPYLEQAAPALPSIIQAVVDHRMPGTRLKLVLAGSHITSMQRLEAADQPLYARRTARLDVKPFPYDVAALFTPGYAPRDRLLCFGLLGGLPGHLALLDPAALLEANVARLLLDPSARLFDEAQHMLDAFLGDAAVHYSILHAIAAGEQTWAGITKRVGKTAGSISRPMHWLMDMQLVTRVVPITEQEPARTKRAIYRIADAYVRTWHRFVAPIVQLGMAGNVPPQRLYDTRLRPRLDDHMGPVLEDVCRAFAWRGRRLPFRPLRVGEWWSRASDAQVDVVAISEDDEVLLGECKWGTADARDLERLRLRAPEVLGELGARGRVHLAIFAGRPITDRALRKAAHTGEVLLFGPDDLYDLEPPQASV